MHLLALATTLYVTFEPITSLSVFAHLHVDVGCPGTCRMLEGALLHSTGEVAASVKDPGSCVDSMPFAHVPFGAHLTPRARWECDGKYETAVGPPVTIAPYLTNVEIDGTTVWVPALAEPRGAERVRLTVWADEGGFSVSREFATRELVMRGVSLPLARLHFRATLEPYGVVSNTRTVNPDAPIEHWTGTSTGCSSTPLLVGLVFFLRRRFPSAGGIC